jgi:hypothetical protein
MVRTDSMVGSGGGVMNDQMFDIYRKASESWFKLQQELFDGLYKSAILLFQQTSKAPAAMPSDDHSRVSDANDSKATTATPKPGPGKPRHSRKAAGRRPERPGARNR